MSEEHIEIEMRPEIIAKASPTLQKIDAKAVAGLSEQDIIERNVIAEYGETDKEDEQSESEASEAPE